MSEAIGAEHYAEDALASSPQFLDLAGKSSRILDRMAGEAQYLERAINRYAPQVAVIAPAAMKRLRTRYPGARVLVFERRGSLPIGFAPAKRGSPVFSIVLYPRWVRFLFLEGIALDDPKGLLEGTGRQVRSLRLDAGAALLDDPYVTQLMAQAVRIAEADLTSGAGHVILKSKL